MVFGMDIFPANDHVDKIGEVMPFNAEMADFGQRIHGYLGYFLLILIALHVAAALKHHCLDKDNTLKRMLGADMNN